ncbi:MAG: hypothetical protein NZ821_08370, partial [Gloeomargarita sp. SKYB31]|nr:hypothetical protein [Gloeomargarita sp. SKYB31]
MINTGTIQAAGGTVTIAAVPGENLVRLSLPGHLLSLEFEPQRLAQVLETDGHLSPTHLPNLLTGAQTFTVHPDQTVQLQDSPVKVPLKPATALVSGKIDVSSSTGLGGQVGILGQQVVLVKSEIEASGTSGGGSIWVGGAFQGKGSLPNAEYTFVSRDSVLWADATVKGDGGQVIVWADRATDFRGTITAKGGPAGGNGGLVEVSGRESLGFTGQVNTSAPKGRAGTLLLDPANIFITSKGIDDAQLSDGQILFEDAPGKDLRVSGTSLVSALAQGNVLLQATNDIVFETSIGAFFGNELSAEAKNNISVLAPLSISKIVFKAGGGIFASADIDTQFAKLFADKNITIKSIIAIDGGNISIQSQGGSIETGNLISFVSDKSGPASAGTIQLTAPGDITTGYLRA